MKKEMTVAACVAVIVLFFAGCLQNSSDKAKEEIPEMLSAVPIPISAENTDAAEPAVALASDGSTLVVWVDHRAGGQADVFLQKVLANGSKSNTPVRINPEVGMATAWRGDPPSIAIAPDGTVFVVWTLRAAGKGHENNLYLSASRDGGVTFGPPVKINDDIKPAAHGMHSLAVDNHGRVFLAWLDERNLSPVAPTEKHRGETQVMEANREVFIAYSSDGGRTISRNLMIARDACPCCKTALTTAVDGKVYAGWRQVLEGDLRHIAVASSADNGLTFSTPTIVSDDRWVIAGCPVSGPALSARENGVLRVLWYTNGKAGTEGLYAARSTDGGRTFSPRELVSGGTVFGNPLLMPESKADYDVAVWQSGDSGVMRAEIMNDGGIQRASLVMTTGKLPAAALANGRTVLAYISSVNKQRSVWLVTASQHKGTTNP